MPPDAAPSSAASTWFRRRTRLQWTVVGVVALAILSFLPDLRPSIAPSHDARLIASSFHILVSSLRCEGEIPLWIPYGRWGNDGFLVVLYTTPVAWVVALASKLLGLTGSLGAFKIVVLLEFLIFIVGSLRLSALLFRSAAAVAVVNIGAVLSFSWLTSFDANLHTFYMMPIILESLIRFTRDGRFGRLLLAALFCVVSAIGNVPYYPPIMALILCLFCTAHLWASDFRIPSLRFSFADLLPVVAIGVLAAAHVGGYLSAFRDLHIYTMGRDSETGRTLPHFFLGYNGVTTVPNLLKAFLTGMHTHGDITFYVGLAPLALSVIAFMRCRKSDFIALAAVAVFLVVFSSGGLVARAAYYFPGMAYYRHIGLIFGQAKYLLLLLAGFGLEALLYGRDPSLVPVALPWKPKVDRLLLAAVIFLVAVEVIGTVVQPRWGWWFYLVPGTLEVSAEDLFLPMARVVVYALCFGMARSKARFRPESDRAPLYLGALLAAFLVDVGSFKVLQIVRFPQTHPEAPELAREAFAVKPLPWRETRSSSDAEEARDPVFRYAVERGVITCVYVHVYSMIGFDPKIPVFRTDSLTKGQHLLLQARNVQFAYLPWEALIPPEDGWLADALGARKPKLRIIPESDIDFATPNRAFEVVQSLPRNSDHLVVEASGSPDLPAATNSKGRVSVTSFGYNHLTLEATVEGAGRSWLYYADADHTGWTARVDGVIQPISRANLAFKALPLAPGTHRVEFRYWNGWGSVCVVVLCFGSLLVFAAGALWLVRDVIQSLRSTVP